MLVTLAFALPAVLVLLALDAAVRGRALPPNEANAGSRLLLAARVLAWFLLAGTLATSCRVNDAAGAPDVWATLGWMALFGAGGVAGLVAARAIGFAVMPGLANAARGGNLAAAFTAAAHIAAIGILIANVAGGTSWFEFGLAAIAFAVGQGTLLALLWCFRLLTAYDDRDEILRGNVAAALSHGGLTIALALVIAHATDGEFTGVWPALRDYGIALAEGLLVYPLRQLVVQCLILHGRPTLVGGEIDRAIAERRDVGAGALEATTYVAAALLVRSLA
jgi:uncharacterized membrane protein YjfL (UPF0719 family)